MKNLNTMSIKELQDLKPNPVLMSELSNEIDLISLSIKDRFVSDKLRNIADIIWFLGEKLEDKDYEKYNL